MRGLHTSHRKPDANALSQVHFRDCFSKSFKHLLYDSRIASKQTEHVDIRVRCEMFVEVAMCDHTKYLKDIHTRMAVQ